MSARRFHLTARRLKAREGIEPSLTMREAENLPAHPIALRAINSDDEIRTRIILLEREVS